MKTQFNSNKFSTKLLINFLLIAITPLIITLIISFFVSYNAIFANSTAVSHEITDYAANEIDRVQHIATEIAQSMLQSSEIQIAMRYDSTDQSTHLITPFHINTSLSLLQRSASSEILDIYCINTDDILYQSNTTARIAENFSDTEWFQQILHSDEPIWFTPHHNSFVTDQDYNPLISYGVPYYDYITGEPNGIILVDINADTVFNNLNHIDSLQSNLYYVLDETNEILFTTDKSDVIIENPTEHFTALSKSNFYYSNPLENHWQVVGVISGGEIAQSTFYQLIWLFVVMLVLSICLAVFISIQRSKQISEPLHTLIESMNSSETASNNETLLIPSSTDEIVTLYRSFNIMINKNNAYIDQIKEEQAALRIANFKALQAQINPHFLYNTLDTITWNIRLQENDKAVSSIMALTRFFRSSLNKGEDVVSLEREFEQVSLYLEIQMYRYEDMLNYTIDYDTSLNLETIPKLSLQPIVENAIYHGIKNKGEFGHIHIGTRLYDDYYIIFVRDDGLGMTEERLAEVEAALNDNTPLTTNTSGGYGTHSVHERIRIYFGDDYGLHFHSKLGEYTEIEIKLPYTSRQAT